MKSKTPQADLILNKILSNLAPQRRLCPQKDILQYCEGEFELTTQDIEFLKLLRAPAPKLCPTCRRIRRFSFVNTTTLYKHPNNAPGKFGSIISFVPLVSQFVVYDLES